MINTGKYLSSVSAALLIVVFCSSITISMMMYPKSFSPVDNWISDLGNHNINPDGAVFFNIGCILSGLILFGFYAGMSIWKVRRTRKAGMNIGRLIGFISAFSLMMVGVFSEEYVPYHFIWASTVFITTLLAQALITLSLTGHEKLIKAIWYYAFISVAASLAFIVTVASGIRMPILEWLSVFLTQVWAAALAYNMLNPGDDVHG